MEEKLTKQLEKLQEMGHIKVNDHLVLEALSKTILEFIKRESSFKDIIDWLLKD